MNHEFLFTLANSIAFLSWAFLIIFPNITVTQVLIQKGIVPVLLSGAYFLIAIVAIHSGAPGGFDTLIAVEQLFESRDWILAGWIHYLAFDLLIGAWIVKDSQSMGFRHIYIIPALVLTFMLGPVGFLIYWFIRKSYKRKSLWS